MPRPALTEEGGEGVAAVGDRKAKEGSDCCSAWIGSNDSREPMMLRRWRRRRRPNKQADWQWGRRRGGEKGAVQLETAPRLNATPLREIWSDGKYRFGMTELQPVLGWGGGCSLARVSWLFVCVCV